MARKDSEKDALRLRLGKMDRCPECGWTWQRTSCGDHCYHAPCSHVWHDGEER